MDDKKYVTYSGYPGGQSTTTPRKLLKRVPERVLENAIKGMLPKNRLGRELFRNLHVYTGSSHPHEAQSPQQIKIKEAE